MRVAAVLVAASGLISGVACTEPSCHETNTIYTASTDVVPPGASAVARVDAAQSYKTYGPVGCSGEPLESVGVVSATITSTSSTPIRLKFSVQGLDATGTARWAFPSGTGGLGSTDPTAYTVDPFQPGQTIDLGAVATSSSALASIRAVVTQYAPLP